LTDDWYELAESTSVEAKEEARGLSFQAKEQGMSALLLKRIRFLGLFFGGGAISLLLHKLIPAPFPVRPDRQQLGLPISPQLPRSSARAV